MDITDLSIQLYDAHQEMINSKAEDFDRAVKRFEEFLEIFGGIFGIDQYNLARYGFFLDRELMRNTYVNLLEENPEIAQVKTRENLPVLMSIDMMDCGDKIAIIESNGFTSRGFSIGDIELIESSLRNLLDRQERVTFAIGYPLEEGRARKSDDLIYEKILYCGALAKEMRKYGKKVKVEKFDGKIENDFDILMLPLPKFMAENFEIRENEIFLNGVRIDFISDNITRTRNDLLNYAISVNSNGRISDSKHLTYKAVEGFLKSLKRESPIYGLYSHRINVKDLSDAEIKREIKKSMKEILDMGRDILIKPDKGSGGGGIYVCGSEDEVFDCIKLAEPYAPDGNILIMERAPIIPVDLDSYNPETKIRSGDLLEKVIRKIHRHALKDGIPDTFLRGRHAVDFRFYVALMNGKEIMKKYGIKNLKENSLYITPEAAILRMAPGIWVDDLKALAEDPTIIKSNISQEVKDKGAKVEYGILRFFVPFKEILEAFNYKEKYRDFMVASFDAVKATIEYNENP
ncbi:MAG: hypothetical protein ACETWM_12125 [Candidatus Lokiarchaeia archaeon]